jgi:membrane-bound serine protease (ClpP class)
MSSIFAHNSRNVGAAQGFPGSSHHRISRTSRLLGLLVATWIAVMTVGPVATAAVEPAPTTVPLVVEADARPDGAFVDILEVTGWIDPVNAEFITQSLKKAKLDGAQAVVVQLNSPGSLLSETETAEFTAALTEQGRVPFAVWVGPSGARARNGALMLLDAADAVGVAGKVEVQRSGEAAMDSKAALKDKIAQIDAPVMAEFIGQLDGKKFQGVTLETAETQVKQADGRTLANLRTVRFQGLGLFAQLLHTVTNQLIVFLLLVVGLGLAVFEFYTGGVGIAAAVAAFCVGLSAYGLGVLPTRPLGLFLVVFSFLAFAIDVQAGQARFWTGVGTIALSVGSLILFKDGVTVPLWWAAINVVMIVLFMVAGMPTMIRTRFATPTIGRESMIGELGTAHSDVAPNGVVLVRGAQWPARTNRSTPLKAGQEVRVAALDGVVLEVEPLEGAARDHRERRTK